MNMFTCLLSGGKESFREETRATVSCSTLPQGRRVTEIYAEHRTGLRNSPDRAIAQVVSRQLPTIAAQVKSCGFCGGRVALWQAFSEYFAFPFHSFIPLIAPQSSPSTNESWYSRPVADFVAPQPQR
jgi:hypothetical protein